MSLKPASFLPWPGKKQQPQDHCCYFYLEITPLSHVQASPRQGDVLQRGRGELRGRKHSRGRANVPAQSRQGSNRSFLGSNRSFCGAEAQDGGCLVWGAPPRAGGGAAVLPIAAHPIQRRPPAPGTACSSTAGLNSALTRTGISLNHFFFKQNKKKSFKITSSENAFPFKATTTTKGILCHPQNPFLPPNLTVGGGGCSDRTGFGDPRSCPSPLGGPILPRGAGHKGLLPRAALHGELGVNVTLINWASSTRRHKKPLFCSVPSVPPRLPASHPCCPRGC